VFNDCTAYRHSLSVCLFLFLNAACWAATNNVDGWIDKAISLELDKSRTWQVLGHYKPHADGWKSLISDTNFFLAATGNENPKAELAATIRAWLDTNATDRGIDCACRFPARICWLKEALNIPATQIPDSTCKNNSALMQRIAPHEAVLVFPGAAFKGLGAMFGHTLIRFDAKDKHPLISYSVNYSALSGGDNLFSYIWKGLTGGFNGYYLLAPYYQKLHEYRDMEERDVWEFPLDLKPDEVSMMVLHSIELQNIATKYYFLDENCALDLLFIIEAGRPSLRLVDHYWNQSAFWVIPSDTILFLWNEGLLKKPEFQSSLSRQIDFLSQLYRPAIINEAKHLADVNNRELAIDPRELSHDEMEIARELAAKIVQYRFSKLQMRQEVFEDKYKALIHGTEPILPTAVPPTTPPQEGHPSGRAEAAFGFLKSNPFFELGWRPAYHDWNDPPKGYPENGTLNFLDIKARYYSDRDEVKLRHLAIIEGGSLSPQNSITRQTAWSFSSDLQQTYLQDCNEHLLGYLEGGAGKSYRVQESGIFYWLIKGSILAGSGLNENLDVGPKIEIGYSTQMGENWQINLTGTTAYYGISEKSFAENATISLISFISPKNAVSLNAELSGIGSKRGIPEVLIRWQHYF
jgi:Domain of unknown function (DUF4105)